MTTQSQSTQRRRWQLFNRGQQWLRISGYHAGDIHSDKPVTITVGSTMKGDIIAPRIVVDGTLDGSVVTEQLEVRKGGQVLGNVFACRVIADRGGKLLGWMKSLETAAYEQIQAEGKLAEPDNPAEHDALPSFLDEASYPANGHGALNLLQQLRAEAASAIAARAELEQAFERRLNEMADASAARAERLSRELEQSQQELAELQNRAGLLSETLSNRDTQVEKQVAEIDLSRKMLAERNEELSSLRDTAAHQRLRLEQLTGENESMEAAVLQANRDAETALDRFESVKTTLQTNLQHTSELEESLLRWQELAEVTEAKVKELETELQTVRLQLEESNQMGNLLRDQRKAAEEALEATSAELQTLRSSHGKEVDPEEFVALQARIQTLEAEAAKQHERLLWATANAEKADEALQTLRQIEEENAALKQQNVLIEETMREQTMQLKAYENEIDRYNEEINQQGTRLADILNLLTERDVELAAANDKIQKLNYGVRQFQDKAKSHIDKLNNQLAQSRQHIKKLEGYIQRQQKS